MGNSKRSLALFIALVIGAPGGTAGVMDAQSRPAAAQRITILVDAFGSQPALHQDWGYAALVEYGGKRILFDTGNDSAGFMDNVRRLGADLARLDAVVISHRHGDHTAGLSYVLSVNPKVAVYVPDDEAFGGPTPPAFFLQSEPSLPPAMRYFNGAVPDVVPHGSAWKGANFVRVTDTAVIAPGFRLVRNLSPTQPFGETPELSLVIDTPQGQVLVVGCSHPGIERIVASVAVRDPKICDGGRRAAPGHNPATGYRAAGPGASGPVEGRPYRSGPLHRRTDVRHPPEDLRLTVWLCRRGHGHRLVVNRPLHGAAAD